MTQGVYVISVAARLLHMHPQTLRKYERVGLVVPSRTIGMLRLYSVEDIVQLKLIKYMMPNVKVNIGNFYCRRQVRWIVVAMASQEINKLMGALV